MAKPNSYPHVKKFLEIYIYRKIKQNMIPVEKEKQF